MYLMSTNKGRSAQEAEEPVTSCLEELCDRRTVQTACFPSTARSMCSLNIEEVSEEGPICLHGWASVRPKFLPSDKVFPAPTRSPLFTKPSLSYTRPLTCESDGSMTDDCLQEPLARCTFESLEAGCSMEPSINISFVSFSPVSDLKKPAHRDPRATAQTPRQTLDFPQPSNLLVRSPKKQGVQPTTNRSVQRAADPNRTKTHLQLVAGQLRLSRPRERRPSQAEDPGTTYHLSIELPSNELKTQSATNRPDWDAELVSNQPSIRPLNSTDKPPSMKAEVASLRKQHALYVRKILRSHQQ